jgi:8-oxo-dGTP pyrophosphatase MutT (NUDIX family)
VIAPWPSLSTETLADYRVFKVRRVVRRSPRTGREHDFFVLESPDWVNVVALTPDGGVVMVDQFRHGTESVDLEIPGGVMDPADASPVATGIRELREETGYEGRDARVIGQVRPNPAIQSNTCYTILIEGCVCRHTVELDHGEDLATRVVPASELGRLVADGTIRHSLVVAALYDFELWQRGVRSGVSATGTGAPSAAPESNLPGGD